MTGDAVRPPDPGAIMRLATSYWESRCFLVANAVGVFESLGRGPRSAESLADELSLARRPTRLLLKALVGLGLLTEETDGFRNAPDTQAFLVRGGPMYLGNAVRYGADMWSGWTELERALRDGLPPIKPESYTGLDPERTRHFVYGMHDRAIGIGFALVPLVDLSGRRQLLDVGGGPGTYSALFARAHPGLRARVMDLPEVAAIAGEILDSLGVRDRVEPLPGDYKETDLPGGNDAVLISGVFHRETEATCRELIARAREALVPGGILVVADVFTEDGGATPPFAALFGLNMMLSAPDGGVHSDAEVAAWMADAGLRDIARVPFPDPMPHRIVTGIR